MPTLDIVVKTAQPQQQQKKKSAQPPQKGGKKKGRRGGGGGVSLGALIAAQRRGNPREAIAQRIGMGFGKQIYAKYGRGMPASVAPYLKTIINPFDMPSGCKYPDETLFPTATNKLVATQVLKINSQLTCATVLGWKMFSYAASLAFTPSGAAAGATWPVIGPASPMNAWTLTSTTSDYGAPQTQFHNLSTLDRTIAAGIRVKLLGLPANTLFPSGRLYLIQYEPSELYDIQVATNAVNEAYFQQFCNAGKGYTCTMEEVRSVGSVAVCYMPLGPNSFVFSGDNSGYAAGNDTSAADQAIAVNSVVSPNGGVGIFGFGFVEGTILEFQYAHHLEFVPAVASSGLLDPQVKVPDAGAREAILQGVANTTALVNGATGIAPMVQAGLTAASGAAGAALGVAARMGNPYAQMGSVALQGLSYVPGAPEFITRAARGNMNAIRAGLLLNA